MKKIETTLKITLCAAAHVDIEMDTILEVPISEIARVLPVDPEIGIGSSVIFLRNGTSLNVNEAVRDLIQSVVLSNKEGKLTEVAIPEFLCCH